MLLRRTSTFLPAVAAAVPLAGPAPVLEPPEERLPGWCVQVLSSAQEAFTAVDQSVREQLSHWRDQVRSAAIAQARSVETDRGMFLYTPPADGAPGEWTRLDGYTGPVASRIVLLVHGLDEPGGIWTDLAPALAEHGHTALRFDYRNDDSASASARELEQAMRDLHRRGITHVDIVAHSMGGLVARDVLTSQTGYQGSGRNHQDLPDVHRLITLGTPNTGSEWARLAALSDMREHIARWMREPGEPRHLLGFLVDGDGHAADDLLPGSGYLEELNSRPLPDGVIITAVVAHMAEIGDEELRWLTEPGPARRILGQHSAQRIAGAIKDASASLGDGVVCVDSGRSVCVEDVVEVAANHRTMIRNLGAVSAVQRGLGRQPRTPPAIPVVLDRLDDE